MPLDLPLYLIVGRQPVSLTRTEDGGLALLGWDFDRGELTREAASWDDVTNEDPADGGETVRVTRAAFDAAIRELGGTPPA